MAGLLDSLFIDPTAQGGGFLARLLGIGPAASTSTPTLPAVPVGSSGILGGNSPFAPQTGFLGNSPLANGLRGGLAGMSAANGYSGFGPALGAGFTGGVKSNRERQLYNLQNQLYGQQFQKGNLDLASGNIGLAQSLMRVNYLRQRLGQPALSLADVTANPGLLSDPSANGGVGSSATSTGAAGAPQMAQSGTTQPVASGSAASSTTPASSTGAPNYGIDGDQMINDALMISPEFANTELNVAKAQPSYQMMLEQAKQGRTWDGSKWVNAPGVVPASAESAGAISRAQSQGTLPADLAKIGATGSQERMTAAYKQGLENASTLVTYADPNTNAPRIMTRAQAMDVANGKYQPATTAAPNPQTGDVTTVDGTVVPPPPPQPQAAGPGFQSGPSTDQAERLKQGADVQKGWYEALPQLEQAEQKFMAIANALKATKSGAWTTEKANVAASLKAVGIDIGKALGDPAKVEQIIHDNMLATIDTLRSSVQGTGSRFTQAEWLRLGQALANPNLQPEANLAILGEAIGSFRFQKALVNDWAAGKQNGWTDPLEFSRQWINKNPISGFVDKAVKDIGPLAGMEGAQPAQGQQPAKRGEAPPLKAGDTQIYNGQKWQFNGGDPAKPDNWSLVN